ncbi:MAG: hypothetical protein C4294_18195 [Nitrospiraceae bacterium]
MLKVLLGPYSKSASGIATYLLELAEALVNMGVKITIFGFKPQPNIFSIPNNNMRNNIDWLPIGRDIGSSIAFLPLQAWLNVKVANKLNRIAGEFDVLHTVSASTSVNLSHINSIITAWSLLINPFKQAHFVTKFYRFPLSVASPMVLFQATLIDRLAYTRAKKIICITRQLRDLLKTHYAIKKVVYIPPVIRIPSKIENIEGKTFNIFYVSRDLSLPRKNFKTFLRALIRLDKVCSDSQVYVHIIGENIRGGLNYIRLLKNLKVKIWGHMSRHKILKLYESVCKPLYVSTSIYEEFNYSLCEALSRGCVAVASNIAVHNDLVINKQTGFLCNAWDDSAFFIRLKYLIDNENSYYMLRRKSLDHVRKKFDWRVVIPKLLKVYSDF